MRFEFTKSDVWILQELVDLAERTQTSKDRPRRLQAKIIIMNIDRTGFKEKIAKYAHEG